MYKRWQIWLLGGAAVGVVILVIANRSNQPVYSLDDDNPAFRAAALRKMSGKTDTRLLIRALDDNDTDVRLLAIERLSASADGSVRFIRDSVDPKVLEALATVQGSKNATSFGDE